MESRHFRLGDDRRYVEKDFVMIDVGDLRRFGFRIGPVTESPNVRDVSIFINGTDVSRHDCSAYLPSYVGSLTAQSEALKRRLDFTKYAKLFARYNIPQIHNILLHGDVNVFADESDWERISAFHRFLDLNEPNTDPLAAFLIPEDNCTLCLTYQYESSPAGFQRIDTVDGVTNLLPYDLIQTIDAAISTLTETT